MKPIEVIEIPTDSVHLNPKNESFYEKLIDDEGKVDVSKISTLVASMNKLGQKEAITVTKDSSGYRIISGNRRYAAARLLQIKTMKAIVLPEVNSDEEDALIVTHNLTREKTYAEKLAEFTIYRKIYSIKDSDIATHDIDFTIPKDEQLGRDEITISEFAKSILNLRSTKLQELLAVAKSRPDLIKEIDDGEYSVHSAYEEIKKEQAQKEQELIPLKLSEPDFNLMYDSERKYADSIINTFREKVKTAKERDKFSLVKLLKESITSHEEHLDKEFEKQQQAMFKLFEEMDKALQAKKFTVLHLNDKNKEEIADLSRLEEEEEIEPDESNGKYNRKALTELRELVLRNLLSQNDYFQIRIKHIHLNLKPYTLLKNSCFDYFSKFSERYSLQKEIRGGRITPSRRKEINRGLSHADKSIRIYLRILCKLTKPFDGVPRSSKNKK